MSVFTMLMTAPQVWAIWVAHQAAGVSLIAWSAYPFSAILRFWHGLRLGDKNAYLARIGRVGLDFAVIVGAVIHS